MGGKNSLTPAHSFLSEIATAEKFVPDDLPSVSKATRSLRTSSLHPSPGPDVRAMATASPSVFLLMVNGQVESAQVSTMDPTRGQPVPLPELFLQLLSAKPLF